LVASIAFPPVEEDVLAAAKEEFIPLVTAEVDDFTKVVKACFLVDSDLAVLVDDDCLTFVTLVFVLLLVPLLAGSFLVTVIFIACLFNNYYVTFS
jgi:hypothetical protein